MGKFLTPLRLIAAMLAALIRGGAVTLPGRTGRFHLYPRHGLILPAIAGGDETPEEKAAREAQEAAAAAEEAERAAREAGGGAGEPPDDWPAEARAAVRRANAEAARRRHEANEAKAAAEALEREKQERERAELDDKTRAEAERDDARAERDASFEQVRRAMLLVELVRPEHGIAPDAVDLVADALTGVEFDEAHRPTNAAERIGEFLEERPSLKVAAGGSGGSPGNPAGGRERDKAMTPEDVRRLARDNPDEFNRRFEAGEIPESALTGG